jgi:predicted dehydrogenase
LHVLCEKPLALREDHLAEISRYLKSGAKSVYTVHNWKFAPIFLKTAELIRSGIIGSIEHVRYEVLRTGPSVAVAGKGDVNWRLRPELSGGGILVDHGWHAFYNVCGWIGKQPLRARAALENRKFKEIAVEDTATVNIDFDHSTAELFFTWAADERKNNAVITGSLGELQILDDVIKCSVDKSETKFPEALSKGSHHPEWYSFIVDDFIRSMKDREFRDGNFKEAAVSLMLTTGAQRSDQAGGVPVDLVF